ncbi:MAG TPA: pre-peptidase C-terminal domain-containing protein [Thermoanaerobaculia bacterium]|nr:pre-peptidase C-terminal domain-containing protein [Thermoanaerobaculia bacterium]
MSRKLPWLLLLAFAFGSLAAHAAPSALVPTPTASSYDVLDVNQIGIALPAQLDLEKIGEEDMARDRKGLPPRFAVPEQVSFTPDEQGTWEQLPDGKMLWRLRVVGGVGTNSLNLGFTRYKMPKGGRLLLYAADGTQVSRAFTAEDNEVHGELWTPVVLTNDLIVEVTVPRRQARALELELGWINQGYRGFGTVPLAAYQKSGSCNLDVECLGSSDTWREEMRAVGVMSTGGSTFCTGSLINNTANDRKMYFITANHCGINSSNAASLVVYWNFQNSFCRTPGSAASGSAGDGSLTQFHTGSIFRASYSPSDVTLVELDDPPVSSYDHHWAGWDRSTGNQTCTASSPCAGIHHPSTDEKRITYVTTDMVSTSYLGTASPGDGTHLWAKWATDPPGPFTVPGVTEPGSSGSPLYNSAGRFVGQLHGGWSACGATGNNLSDHYGRFSVSWTGGGTNSTRVSNWLDPGSTGATTTNGLNVSTGPCTPPAAPTGVSASAASASQVNLSWGAVSGAVSYTVLRSTTSGGPYSSVGSATGTSFSNTGASCNTTYYYVVTASNGSCSSGNSAQVQATTSACTGNVLANGVPVTGISGATGSEQFWTLSVPSGASNLQFQIAGGSGDADMYVRFGSAPNTTTYDCRPYLGGNSETCTFPAPSAGTWHVMLRGYSAYSGVSLTGSYSTGSTCTATAEVEPNNSTGAPQVISGACNQISGTFLNDTSTGQNDYFRLSLPAGKTVTALLNGLTVDYDVYIHNSAGTQVASSTNGGATADTASWTNTGASAVNVFVRVYRYSSTRTTYQLKVSYP